MRLTLESPFASRFLAWIHERFPLVNAVLFLVLYASALFYGRALAGGGAADATGRLAVNLPDVAGFFAVWAFFLMLRVFDEHKDYALDLENHPKRVLQSGLVTLSHLKVVGAVAIAIQLGASMWLDHGVGRVTIAWAIVMAYSALMAKEFFIGEWLGKRLVPYALSHMMVMPLALLWMAQMGARSAALPSDAAYLALLAFFSGLAFEIARKTKAPEDERAGVDTYTKALGLRGAPVAIVIVLLVGTGVLAVVLRGLYQGSVPVYAWIAIGVSAVLPVIAVARFLGSPSPKGAKGIEGMVSLSMLTGYVVLIACIVSQRGVAWTGSE